VQNPRLDDLIQTVNCGTLSSGDLGTIPVRLASAGRALYYGTETANLQ